MSSEQLRGLVLAEQRLLTVREVAAAMRVSSMTVYRLIKSGALPAARVGRGYRIWSSALDTYLERVEG